ncbi:hypothetical protein [Nocardia carnea]|uniref:hypothetical protein n=1 Tax=Nocardia carnea TaxID=37328 RepID=UPI0024580DB3|nr:hypothetical protein [Nocardia carnea]
MPVMCEVYGSTPACGKAVPGYPVVPGPTGASVPPAGSGGGCGARMYSIHQPASISARAMTPDPPSPTPTGPIVLTAMASATISTIVLVWLCESGRLRPSDSAIDVPSPGSGNRSHPIRYRTIPAPPKMVDTTNATRTSTGSTP